jgi:Uma2 family endonuclease
MATDLATQCITPEQLAMMPNDKEFELVEGRLVERKMGNKSSWIANQLAMRLGNYVDEHRLGWVFVFEAGYRLSPDRPNNVRKPDVSFVAFGRLPNEEPADGYDHLAPDLAIEVTSPHDTVHELEEKVEEYLAAGVRMVWVINSELRAAKVYLPDGRIQAIREDQELDGGDVVLGFHCRLGDIFEYPKPQK